MKRKTKIYIFDCLMMAALAFLFALMYELFVAPNHFAPSGVNGIATMIEYVTDGAFSVGYFSLIVNIPLCVAAFFLIDRGFAVKTFIFSLLYSVFLLVLRAADLSQFQYDAQGVDTIYPVLIAGAISGFVYGLAVRRNSSTGGADVIAKYVSKKNPLLNFFGSTSPSTPPSRRYPSSYTPSGTAAAPWCTTTSRWCCACCTA